MRCRPNSAGGCRGGAIPRAAQVTMGGGPGAPSVTTWAHGDADAVALLSSTDTQTFADAVGTSGADWWMFSALQADTSLGGVATYRAWWSYAGDNSDLGSNCLFSRNNPDGKFRVLQYNDSGTTIANSTATSLGVVASGDVVAIQVSDKAPTFIANQTVRMGGVQQTLSSYNRGSLGDIDYYSPIGRAFGATPSTQGPLGWTYCHMVVLEDMSSHLAAIDTAWSDAYDSDSANLQAAYDAVLAYVVANVSDTGNILFAQAFSHGSTADYGDDVTMVGITYTEAGVSP